MKILVYREGRNFAKLTWVISVSSVTQECRSAGGCHELGHPCVSSRGPLPLSSRQSLSWELCTDETKACLDSACWALIGGSWNNAWYYKNTSSSLMHSDTHEILHFFVNSLLPSSLCFWFQIWLLIFYFLSHVLESPGHGWGLHWKKMVPMSLHPEKPAHGYILLDPTFSWKEPLVSS